MATLKKEKRVRSLSHLGCHGIPPNRSGFVNKCYVSVGLLGKLEQGTQWFQMVFSKLRFQIPHLGF